MEGDGWVLGEGMRTKGKAPEGRDGSSGKGDSCGLSEMRRLTRGPEGPFSSRWVRW